VSGISATARSAAATRAHWRQCSGATSWIATQTERLRAAWGTSLREERGDADEPSVSIIVPCGVGCRLERSPSLAPGGAASKQRPASADRAAGPLLSAG
jgi:hypothetical protein